MYVHIILAYIIKILNLLTVFLVLIMVTGKVAHHVQLNASSDLVIGVDLICLTCHESFKKLIYSMVGL